MRKLLVCLAAGTMLAMVPFAAMAQQAVTIDGVRAMQVVIAPPDSPIAEIIKDKLNAAYYGAHPSTRAYDDAQKLYYFYGARHFEPIWLKTAADGTVGFSPAADKIIAVFKDAAAEGFNPSDYLTPAIDISSAGADPQKLAAIETAFSGATVHYAHDAYLGRVAPQDVSSDIDPETKHLDAADILLQLASSDTPDKILADLDPPGREFNELKAALAKLDTGETPPTPIVIPAGKTLVPGMADPRLDVLRQRLDVADPAADEDGDIYGPALVDAVKTFQANAGTKPDGIVGPRTLAALNHGTTGTAISKQDIIANMERWRWLPHDLGDFHVLVNIPEFRVAVVDNDNPIYSTRVIVGKPATPTPLFSNAIRNIVVNPYWNVPASIVAKEIAPHMAANPGYLARENMQVVSSGHVIDPSAIDWAGVTQSNWRYSVRQLPGNSNSLGIIKFLFPNDHNVYLHDTPSKSLFANGMRAFSHGCVRVQNPMDFANALLTDEPGLTVAMLKSMFGPAERWVNLKTHVPVHIAYFTVRADADGTLHSFGDIYGHNKKLISLLDGTGTPAAPAKAPRVSGV